MTRNHTLIFVCEHGAAKSIIAAADFNQLASVNGLNMKAIARGTNPGNEVLELVVKGLTKDGLTPSSSRPQKLALEDVHAAHRIVSFCELPAEYGEATIVEQWHDVPPVSQDYDKARNAILENIQDLLSRIGSSR